MRSAAGGGSSRAYESAAKYAAASTWLEGMPESPTQAGIRGLRYAPFHPTEQADPLEPHVVILYVDGRTHMRRAIGGLVEEVDIGPGDLSLQPAEVPSFWTWDDPIDVLHLYFPRPYVRGIAERAGLGWLSDYQLATRLKIEDERIARLGQSLVDELRDGSLPGANLMAQAICTQVVVELLRRYFEPPAAARGPQRKLSETERRRLRDFVEAHLDQPLAVGELAAVLGLGGEHFSRVFHENFGATPSAWVRERRLEAAVRLLGDPRRSIGEIALLTGFSDQSHLTRCFKQRFGVPPARFRRRPDGDASR